MRTQAPLTQLQGKLGESVGNFVVPTRGTIRLELQGQMLCSQQKTAFNLETKTTYLPLKNIDSIEIVSGPIWWLLWVGLITIIWIIGIIFIIAFFLIKRERLVVHSGQTIHILFFPTEQQKRVQQFTQTVLTQLQSASTPPSPKRKPSAKKPG
ncbi:hypothetical protein PN462_11510 [Spirulina sp. CS-785/01]|uniref:hypothetical protein n=1 Tax=Spirulina sp. CS-785/01 TaxID=3021716 RepID=UPI00232DCB9C|nr:hypothetical protein [Spirulina sp. CS-785/01]MDB9313728.1 hypothetical protein [Spirulina sp. CS-785/01]